MTPQSRPNPAAALPLSHVAYHLLVALAAQNRHGYGVIKFTAESTGDRVQLEAGSLYAAIKRMKAEGWIEDAATAPDQDARRRTYAITAYGREILLAECRRLEAMVELARRAEVLPSAGRAGS